VKCSGTTVCSPAVSGDLARSMMHIYWLRKTTRTYARTHTESAKGSRATEQITNPPMPVSPHTYVLLFPCSGSSRAGSPGLNNPGPKMTAGYRTGRRRNKAAAGREQSSFGSRQWCKGQDRFPANSNQPPPTRMARNGNASPAN
jgi:hypothetical protein